jgi:dipeptidyl-peptidase-3
MDDFKYMVGSVGDVKILRYQIPGWDLLTKKQKNLLWCLYNASLHGRDIYYDQAFQFGLYIRKVLEMILKANLYVEPPSELTEDTQWDHFMEYIQLYWMNRGIHDDTSGDKVMPKFTQEYFIKLMHSVTLPPSPADCNLLDIIFDDSYPKKKTVDSVEESATNFYFGLTTEEVVAYHKELEEQSADDPEPEEHGLNSQLVKNADGQIEELRWFMGGMYGPQLRKCVEWLTKALDWAENDAQKKAFESLIKFYETGSLKDWIVYCKDWVADTESNIDMIHGFIETYDDPLGHRGSFEAVVTVIDPIASKRIKMLQENAQWFEDNSPVLPEHKRKNAKGVDARVVNVVIEGGDAAPRTPIGINLPNAEWFRSTHGSKSINMANIVNSYDQVSKQYKVSSEFYLPDTYKKLQDMSNIAMDILVDMHEVLGHGSGQVEPHVGDAATAIGGTFGILEEARADLFACYYIMDPYVVEIGLLPDLEAGKALYDTEITNGIMMQLTRVPAGKKTLTDTHMRDRQLIAGWVYERASKDKSIVKVKKNGKIYFEIKDYARCRVLFGELLCEIQRIKSQGDRKAAEALVEKYGTHVDQALHKEVLKRFAKFDMPPMSGFIQPELHKDEYGEVTVTYPEDFTGQMLHYAETFTS